MSESQRPKPAASPFVIPDLELEPEPRSGAKGRATPSAPMNRAYSAPNLFDEDPFDASGLSIEINQDPSHGEVDFGNSFDFDAAGGFELSSTAQPLANESGPHSVVTRRTADTQTGAAQAPAWPSGTTPAAETLTLDPMEIEILADFGAAPSSVHLTPLYAYRVFTRQRELKQRLSALSAQRDRALAERESTLAELGRAVRLEAEKIASFRRFFAPLLELEQVATERGQALSSVNAALAARSAAIDVELTQIAHEVREQQVREQEASRMLLDHELHAQRAEAKLKRVQIEIRAVTHVAEQKLGPAGGLVPEPEAAQLAVLRERALGIEPEVAITKASVGRAKLALGEPRAQLDTLRQAERKGLRKKQALGAHYRKELQVRSAGLSESEAQRTGALADIARAVLAAHGAVPVEAAWLERVRNASERANVAIRRAELQRRALDAYDRAKVSQGVRLACTVLGLLLLLIALKMAL